MAEPAFDLRRFMDDATWMADANCIGLNQRLFFPERGEDSNYAKTICRHCDVQAECLAYALNNDEHYGIWGGKSERERRVLRSRRRIIATGPPRLTGIYEHGTIAGFQMHHRRGTPPCPACLHAHAQEQHYARPSRAGVPG